MSVCPYYDENYKQCAFFRSSLLDQATKDYRCMSDSNWKSCANYTNRSFDEKVSKKLRTNPEL
jgi:hypothetical protein